jgi:hypothetical protein
MWTNQSNNVSENVKCVVWFNDDNPQKSQTYHAFKAEEKSGRAVIGLRKRLIEKKLFGLYKTAIIYDNGREVEKWVNGVKM